MLLVDREADMGCQSRAEPERPDLVLARAFVPSHLDDVGQQLRNRDGFDKLDLTADEVVERLAVDPVLNASSLPLV